MNEDERLEQIRQVNEELMFLEISLSEVKHGTWDRGYIAVVERILTREQAIFNSLRRGMKQPAAQTATE